MGFWKDFGQNLYEGTKKRLDEMKEYREMGRSMNDEQLLKALKNSSGARKSGFKMAAEERGLI